MKKKYHFTSEGVTEGYLDKLCNLILKSILYECLKLDKEVRATIETFAYDSPHC